MLLLRSRCFVLALAAISPYAIAQQKTPLERTVCGWFAEPLLFDVWRRKAGTPSLERVAAVPSAVPIEFKTSDNRVLRGYRLPANAPVKGTLLFAQGNAMLADQMLKHLSLFAQRGFDVHVYDFRGYGLSEGVPRLNAIANDYKELTAHHSSSSTDNPKLYLYGVSFGGLLLINALPSTPVEAVVIDSTPSVASDQGCPPIYDPIEHVPEKADHVMLVRGEKDLVVKPPRTAALAERLVARGGRVHTDPDFAHPFMDSADVSGRRFWVIEKFLTNRKGE